MNLFGVLHKVLNIIDRVVLIIISVYSLYALFSPGLYVFFILYVTGIVSYILFSIKMNKVNKDRCKEYGEVEIIEHMYAHTYRKRFYSVIYFVTILSMLIISSCGLFTVICMQFDGELNSEFKKAMDYMYGETGLEDVTSALYKISPVIPNSTKKIIVETSDSIKWANELVAILTQISECTDEEVIRAIIEPYVIEMKERQQNVEYLCNFAKLEIVLIALILFMCKCSLNECLAYTKHRSIVLR